MSGRSRLRPQTAILLSVELATLTLLLGNAAPLGLLAGLAALYAFAGATRRQGLLALLVAGLATWSVMVSQGLFYAGEPRTALVRLVSPAFFPFGEPPGMYLYGEGLVYGLVQSLRFDVMILLGAGLIARYGSDELTDGLRRLRLPAPLCFLFSMALRHLPLLGEDVRTTWQALRLRGLSPLGSRLLRPLAAANLRRADEIAAALIARGFSPQTGGFPRGAAAPLRERTLCLLGLALLLALAGVEAAARLNRVGALDWPALEPLFAFLGRYG
jgi:energy-coupling factor transport system permease protein